MRAKPPACVGCPLQGESYAPGEGPSNAKIVLVGEALGQTEALTGRPFVGGTGQMLRSMLRQAGILEREIYITNTVKCRPPGNRTPKPAEIHFCTSAHLWNELACIKPNVVVPVGDTALHALLPSAPSGITDVRGAVFDSSWGKVIPIVHPSFIARGNPMYWAVSVVDLLHVKEESNARSISPPRENFNIFPSIEDCRRLRDFILSNGCSFSFDIETLGDRENINLLCIGFAWSQEDAFCIPFLKRGGFNYWQNEEEETEAWQIVGDLLTSSNEKITQNGFTFDLPVLSELGMKVCPPVVDTLVNHHIVATELPHSLKFLKSIYFPQLPYYKGDVKDMGGFLWAPDKVLRTYNCRDCVVTWKAKQELEKEMVELGLL